MYAIIVYDVSVDRVLRVNKFLYRFLYWRQNSVFEGKLTRSQLREIINWCKENLKDEDKVIIYLLKTEKFVRRVEIGKSQPMARIL